MKIFDCIAWILLVVGGLNWGAAAFNMNFVEMLFGAGTTAAQIVYGAVGLAAIWAIIRWNFCSSSCKM